MAHKAGCRQYVAVEGVDERVGQKASNVEALNRNTIVKKSEGKKRRIVRAKAALAVIDIQERLLPAIFEGARVVQNTVRLIKGARVLGLPVLVTEQYKKGLGATTPTIAAEIEGLAQMEKVAFSACGAADFNEALKAKKVGDVILCGIEAHVCVSQTCLDLLDNGFKVFVWRMRFPHAPGKTRASGWNGCAMPAR
jgi:nicotinamidase-related amidase